MSVGVVVVVFGGVKQTCAKANLASIPKQDSESGGVYCVDMMLLAPSDRMDDLVDQEK